MLTGLRAQKASLRAVQPLYRHKGQPLADEILALRARSKTGSRTARFSVPLRRRAAALAKASSFSIIHIGLPGYERIRARRGTGKAIIALARKFLSIIYYTLKNNWVFEDFPNFVLAEAKT